MFGGVRFLVYGLGAWLGLYGIWVSMFGLCWIFGSLIDGDPAPLRLLADRAG